MCRCHGWAVSIGLLIALPSCTNTVAREPAIRFQDVNIAVPVGCVVNRPEPVRPMNTQISNEAWDSLPPGSKARAVEAQGGDRMNYTDRLEAATKGCADTSQ